MQSSSGTTALSISLIRAGLMTMPQAVGIIMGANIGTTDQTGAVITIQFGGSTSVDAAIEVVGEAFKAEVPRFNYVLNQTGSSDGYKRTLGSEKNNNPAHIGFASREFKDTEVVSVGLAHGTFARDGIAVVVHEDKDVTNLTKQQVLDIYTGVITNWSEINASISGTINVYTRDSASGTRGAFQEIIGFEDEDLVATHITTTGNGHLASSVGADTNGIGYVSLSTDFDGNHINGLQFEGVDPTKANVLAGTYTLARPFNYVTRAANDFATDEEKQLVEAFIAYLGTKDAMALMTVVGVIVDDTNAPTWEDISDNYPITN